MIICYNNVYYAQNLQKWAYDNDVKLRNYVLGDKVWLNSKQIKIKYNQKLKAKLFELFWVLHPMSKTTYKLELPKK